MTLHSEILEQPERLERLLQSQRGTVEAIANDMRTRSVPYVFLAARGTSDNAGRYANYILGGMNGLPLALATPSLFTYYQRPPKLNGALVVGISQSGQSPDIVSVLDEGRRQGCMTLAVTNSPDSPLGRAADFVLDIQAGPELSIAATKTYTAELMAIAMLSAALNPERLSWDMLAKVPGGHTPQQMQAAAGIADSGDEFAFDETVHVLVGRRIEDGRIRDDQRVHLPQSVHDVAHVGGREHAGPAKRLRPRHVRERPAPVLAAKLRSGR